MPGIYTIRCCIAVIVIVSSLAAIIALPEPAHADVLPPRPKPKPRPPKPQPPLPKPLPPIEETDALRVTQSIAVGLSASAVVISLGLWMTRKQRQTLSEQGQLGAATGEA